MSQPPATFARTPQDRHVPASTAPGRRGTPAASHPGRYPPCPGPRPASDHAHKHGHALPHHCVPACLAPRPCPQHPGHTHFTLLTQAGPMPRPPMSLPGPVLTTRPWIGQSLAFGHAYQQPLAPTPLPGQACSRPRPQQIQAPPLPHHTCSRPRPRLLLVPPTSHQVFPLASRGHGWSHPPWTPMCKPEPWEGGTGTWRAPSPG